MMRIKPLLFAAAVFLTCQTFSQIQLSEASKTIAKAYEKLSSIKYKLTVNATLDESANSKQTKITALYNVLIDKKGESHIDGDQNSLIGISKILIASDGRHANSLVYADNTYFETPLISEGKEDRSKALSYAFDNLYADETSDLAAAMFFGKPEVWDSPSFSVQLLQNLELDPYAPTAKSEGVKLTAYKGMYENSDKNSKIHTIYTVYCNPKDGLIREVRYDIAFEIYSSKGTTTGTSKGSFKYTNVEVNVPISSEMVTFNPPANAKKVTHDTMLDAPSKEGTEIAFSAPNFTLPNAKGENVSLTTLRGVPTIIYFWARWATSYSLQMTELSNLLHDNAGKLNVIAVNFDTDTAEPKSLFEKGGWGVTGLFDGKKTADIYKISQPEIYILDKNGIITAKITGIRDKQELQETISKLDGK